MSLLFTDNAQASNIIELRNIEQSYNNGKTKIIQNLDLLIEDKPMQGQFAVILGMSGCGKSTLLRYIAGLQQPTSGSVLVKGQPVSKQNRVSMVFQQYSSLPWMTVLDNVGLALKFEGISKKERDQRAMEMIQLVGLDGHQKKYAQYPNLSGGQLQRIAIARSLMSNPEILLMDEPFGALDVKTRLQMQDLLINIWEKFSPTILFVTHDIQEAVYLADDIYIMKHAPSNFVKHINVDLPFQRNRDTKRLPHFDHLVHQVEDAMMAIDSEN
ncbi:ABC transporter ATP-binding protein [Tenacibaculum finnmarkense]|uniref:ABC transporter ATP-binding protein n=1 Tax=Tenacibaculum finnmarkense TaxID=2781243 RepID=UPI00187B78B0|nr:ABC transporter ATP-binding protein [Tenacibaculum finnmarkense]MBE7644967.1 ATP-binding cassette domain-containing protein [Tenacibaculum finnmarkense genomovar ulcerans]MCG8858032.1 ABC transporter ATP-binding protein [Tenacibaculum finnmarkense]